MENVCMLHVNMTLYFTHLVKFQYVIVLIDKSSWKQPSVNTKGQLYPDDLWENKIIAAWRLLSQLASEREQMAVFWSSLPGYAHSPLEAIGLYPDSSLPTSPIFLGVEDLKDTWEKCD